MSIPSWACVERRDSIVFSIGNTGSTLCGFEMNAIRTRQETNEQFLLFVTEALAEFLPDLLKKFAFEKLVSRAMSEGRPAWHRYYEEPSIAPILPLELIAGRKCPDPKSMNEDLKSILVDVVESFQNENVSELKKRKYTQLYAEISDEQFMDLYAKMLALLAVLEYNESLPMTYKKAKQQHNRTSLFQLIAMDKTILSWEWVQKEIVVNQLKNNTRFFNGLSKAIKSDPFAKRKKQVIEWLQIQILWMIAAPHKNYREFHSFLRQNTEFKLPGLKTFIQRLRRCGLTRIYVKSTISNPVL